MPACCPHEALTLNESILVGISIKTLDGISKDSRTIRQTGRTTSIQDFRSTSERMLPTILPGRPTLDQSCRRRQEAPDPSPRWVSMYGVNHCCYHMSSSFRTRKKTLPSGKTSFGHGLGGTTVSVLHEVIYATVANLPYEIGRKLHWVFQSRGVQSPGTRVPSLTMRFTFQPAFA